MVLDKNNTQIPIAAVERMPRSLRPLAMRDWRDVSRRYYNLILDPNAKGDSFPVVNVEKDKPGFAIKDYVGSKFNNEGLTCLSAVVGAKLAGLDPRKLHGVNYVERAKAWYDPGIGIYRNKLGDRSPVVHADIYGYWSAILGMELAAQYPDDPVLKAQALRAPQAFLKIARGLGAPENPNYDVLGWDFSKNEPGGRPEPMNRFGHAPSVAWVLMVGARLTGDPEMLRCARATMQWYIAHPGRYEISHVMGPLTAAGLNVQGGQQLDMTRVLNAWFGDGDVKKHSMFVTAGTNFNGMTLDGLDAAKWPNNEFYAFTMGTLQNPGWLVPVARYDQRYARAIARFALHAANSTRLLQGEGLDAEHQDHAAWKAKWDKDNLLFYEGLMSSDPGSHVSFYGGGPNQRVTARPLRPYATGDPVLNNWGTGRPGLLDALRKDPDDYIAQRAQWFGDTSFNIGLYGGNHVGFLGGIVAHTDVPGILRWDCVATDWFHAGALPTHLYYNPFEQAKTVVLRLDKPASLYDTVTGRFLALDVKASYKLTLAPDQVAVIVHVPPGAKMERKKGQLLANGIVVDYRAPR